MTRDEHLLSHLHVRLGEYLGLLETITRIESHTSQRDGVAAVAAVVLDRLAVLGFESEVVPQPGVPPELAWLGEVMSPGVDYSLLADTYIVRRSGVGTDRLLLLGDLDTAFPPGSSIEFPFQLDGPLARGPGVADMKGGLVVLVAALESLHQLGRETVPVTIVLSGDEQAGSLGSRRSIERESMAARWVFCVECARARGRLMGARAQVGVGRLTVVGQEAYAGVPTDRGINAVEALAVLVPNINRLASPPEGVFVSVNLIHGGKRRSVIPDQAVAVIDVRTPSAVGWKQAAAALESIIHSAPIEADVVFDLHSHRPAVEWTETTARMLENLKSMGRDVGLEIEAVRSPAAGSSAFAAAKGVATLDGMGPVRGGIMTLDERIVIESIVERGALLARAIGNIGEVAV